MQNKPQRIVICEGSRTPIGHVAKSLASLSPEKLLQIVIKNLLDKTALDPKVVDGVLIGWVGEGSHAPNIARIGALLGGIPEKAGAMTIQCNCISGMEAVSAAARHIMLGEGKLYIAGGTESMSTFPYAIRGNRAKKALRSIDALKANWGNLWEEEDISIVDCTAEGLTDPVKKINMAQTAELCAQKYSISRTRQDAYTLETFKRCLTAQKDGFYDTHLVPIKDGDETVLTHDEYPFLRKNLIKKPTMFSKTAVLFDRTDYPFSQFYKDFSLLLGNKKYEPGKTEPTVTLFNSCPRSDGAAALIVTSFDQASKLNLNILAEITSWAYMGCDPAYMGISPALATHIALQRAELDFEQLKFIELHEAFAATVLSVFEVGSKEFGHNWEKKWQEGLLNSHGGSIALGHPLAATGTRLLLNLAYAMNMSTEAEYGLAAACAAGGLGGAIVLKKIN